jgi:hypothetical protein
MNSLSSTATDGCAAAEACQSAFNLSAPNKRWNKTDLRRKGQIWGGVDETCLACKNCIVGTKLRTFIYFFNHHHFPTLLPEHLSLSLQLPA